MAPILQVTQIVAGYGEAPILRGVSLHVEPGELVAVIGPNGAGKSTLIKTIFGVLRPTSGQVTYDGRDITNWAPEKVIQMGMSYIPQVSNVFRTMTVRENMEMGAFILNFGGLASPLLGVSRALSRRLPVRVTRRSTLRYYSMDRLARKDLTEKIDGVIRLFPDLKARLGERVGNLSGGQQQMVALARALMLKPKVLLIDEPSAGLAPILVDSVLRQIGVINKTGTAVVLVEQNARKALQLADRGYILEAGQNRLDDRAEHLLRNPEIGELFLGGGTRGDTAA